LLGLVVKHWAAHTASKQHRTSLQRVKADQEKAAAKAAKRRKPVQTQDENNASVEEEGPALPIDENDSEPAKKKTRTDAPSSVPNPVIDAELDSFLSSLSALPTLPSEIPEPSTSTSNPKTQTKKPYKPSQQETQTAYESAPSLILPNTSSISAAPSAASNPFAGRLTVQEDIEGPVVPTAEDGAEDEEEEETEPERRARLEREEREEIMDRLEEESRAQ
jgi:zinc finger protein 830